ncbi:MAG TPA: response regulator [Caulobacteraceae bacterium]|jgi:CheY-like chemotaxis protein
MDSPFIILVVEDEQLVRFVAVEALSERGFQVLEAEHAAAALGVLERLLPHVLFTDVHMPGEMSGIELAELASARHPAMKIIITSALPLARPVDHLTAHFLRKPYAVSELHTAVDTALRA